MSMPRRKQKEAYVTSEFLLFYMTLEYVRQPRLTNLVAGICNIDAEKEKETTYHCVHGFEECK